MPEPKCLGSRVVFQATINEQKRIVVVGKVRLNFSFFFMGHSHAINFEMFQIAGVSLLVFAKCDFGNDGGLFQFQDHILRGSVGLRRPPGRLITRIVFQNIPLKIKYRI